MRKNSSIFRREIFRSGRYIQYFRPEDLRNPFHRLYAQKRQDTIDIIRRSGIKGRILDIGGGMGRIASALVRSPQIKVVLADISLDMLELARKRAGVRDDLSLICSDAHLLPFEEGSFDCIIGLDLLCHLRDPEIAVREFHRVLDDQGMLILDSTNSNPVWAFFYPRYLGLNPIKWWKVINLGGVLPGWEGVVKHYSKREFLSFLRDAGFKVMENLYYGPGICPKWHLAVSKKTG